VLNSVSPGAELLAEGNIHVYGALNGRALAGVKGKTDALICCSALGSELVSIAGTYVLQDDIKKRYFGQAVSIELNEDNLSFKLLN
jgi:septum site-determining protein MinC